jgi:hypothetical protein
VKLPEKERKLLLLAFDPGAAPGEAVNAVCALAKSWLGRYPDGHALVEDLEKGAERTVEKTVYVNRSPYGRVTLGFGKYAGCRLDEIPVDYLCWVLEEFDDLWPSTRRAIERYLEN